MPPSGGWVDLTIGRGLFGLLGLNGVGKSTLTRSIAALQGPKKGRSFSTGSTFWPAEGNTTTYTYSDRDLMTQQASPVSGVTTTSYNEHGEQVMEIDARGTVMNRSVDALGRVTAMTYPSPDLDVSYTYDDPAVPFSKGRLTRIARHGESVDYRYDRFGRTLQDGALAYGYDANGNPTSLLYPGGVEAVTAYDYADRPATLLARRPGQPDQPLVTATSYLPSGPLSSLTLGNGITEARTFNDRYFPSGIAVGSLLSWSYSTDGVGNILSIADTLNAANNRTYGYQDFQYFLTLGNGPWGMRSWSYDHIGNRLTETRGTGTDTYQYLVNGTGGNTPKIDQIVPSAGPTALYSYDQTGNVLENGILPFTYGDDRRLSQSGNPGAGPVFTYDGRGYLSRSRVPLSSTAYTDETIPTYSSEGLLLHRFAHRNLLSGIQVSSVRDSNLYVFYFAGRLVATLDKVTEGPPTLEFTTTWALSYLIVDHLGTPILVTDPAGTQVWQGGFEPFGADYNSSATILRFPGQWLDVAWGGSQGIGLYYNVHRWYEARTGRYTQPDPLGGVDLFLYTIQRPTAFVDPLGLCCQTPEAKNLFNDITVGVAVGTVICCDGQRTPCLNMQSPYLRNMNPMLDPPFDTIFMQCALEHEEQHFNDVECPLECGISMPGRIPEVTREKSECLAFLVQAHCMQRMKSACGGDFFCNLRVKLVLDLMRKQTKGLGCPGWF